SRGFSDVLLRRLPRKARLPGHRGPLAGRVRAVRLRGVVPRLPEPLPEGHLRNDRRGKSVPEGFPRESSPSAGPRPAFPDGLSDCVWATVYSSTVSGKRRWVSAAIRLASDDLPGCVVGLHLFRPGQTRGPLRLAVYRIRDGDPPGR